MTTPESGDQVRPCGMCEQYGHMISTAEYRDEMRLANVLAKGLTGHQAKHHPDPLPRRLAAVKPNPEDHDGRDA